MSDIVIIGVVACVSFAIGYCAYRVAKPKEELTKEDEKILKQFLNMINYEGDPYDD